MPLGEVARCWKCKSYRSGEELKLNRTNWEYECEDEFVCNDKIEKVKTSPSRGGHKKRKPKVEGPKRPSPSIVSFGQFGEF